MIRMKKFYLILLALVIVLGGCRGGKPVAPRYYMIEYNPSVMIIPDPVSSLPYNVEITDIDIHPAFATSQIAIREEDHEVGYFVNHQWATRPQQSFERFTLNYLKHNNVFKYAERKYWNTIPEYKLFISIHNLEVIRQGKDFYARLHTEFRLETAAGEIVDIHINDNSRLLEKRNLNLFTRAINSMYFEELNFFAHKIHFALAPAL
jgi:ABC-type uncharacterized transport system auxiliary subunit